MNYFYLQTKAFINSKVNNNNNVGQTWPQLEGCTGRIGTRMISQL